MSYNHQEIEKKWQAKWAASRMGQVDETASRDNALYYLIMFPYPSGSGLHVGHVESQAAIDILARMERMRGKNVLCPIGYDAFGLPAENYAIKTGVHPAETTKKAIANFHTQMKSLGLSFDWSREISTADPEYYKWTQWLFLLFYKNGLAYRKKSAVNWCDGCHTVLANEQVVNGSCERCSTVVIQKDLEQWFFNITKYADRLLAGLDSIDWPEKIKTMQRNWIGKSVGAEIQFEIVGAGLVPALSEHVTVFTTRPDTLFGATYLVLAPEHSLVDSIVIEENRAVVEAYRLAASKKSALERTELQKEKSGVFTGAYAINPATGEKIPVWIADYVITTYGTGAIMAVPAHDERDFEFAKKYSLPIKQVVAPHTIDQSNPPRDGMENTVRKVVHVILENTKGEVLTLNLKGEEWGDQKPKTFIIGGIEEGETPEDTALREIQEETGYTDVECVNVFPIEFHAEFFAAHKNVNRYVKTTGVLCRLKSEKQNPISNEEQKLHDLVWVEKNNIVSAVTIPDDLFLAKGYKENIETYTDSGVLIHSGNFDGLHSEDAKAKMISWLEEKGIGNAKTTFRVRDWLVSRQRYWGAPIPIIWCEDCGAQPVEESQLPVELPTDVDFKPTGESPLVDSVTFHNVKCPKCGKDARRESDTMDTFVDSSWYYLRYTDPHNANAFADKTKIDYWCPVDLYLGGAEHAVMHLLYARFFAYALYDLGYLSFEEPFLKLKNQGLILGPDGDKMSKSKGNVVNPDDVVMEYGADALRIYEMFMGPLEDAKPWDTKGVVGVRRFLDKVEKLSSHVIGGVPRPRVDAHMKLVHKAIKKITADLEDLKFNTAISQLMIVTNEFSSVTSIDHESFETFLKLLAPLAPHLAEELWEKLGHNTSIFIESWPTFDAALIVDDVIEMGVQVNGKVRGTISIAPNADEATAKELAMANPNVVKWMEGKEIVKIVYVKGKIFNIVVK